jgi:hypothetical protein
MFPHERSLVNQLKDKPFALLGVSTDRSRQDALGAQDDGSVTWRNWWNGDSPRDRRLTTVWGVEYLPQLFMIDHKGVIRRHFVGVPSDAELSQEIDKWIKEADKE